MAGLLVAVACNDDDTDTDDDDDDGSATGTGTGTGTGSPSGSSTGTGTGTGTGSASGSPTGSVTVDCEADYEPDSCELVCCQLWVCIETHPDECPGMTGFTLQEFFDGVPPQDGCLQLCADNPEAKEVMNPDNCVGTLQIIKLASPEFAAACADE